MPEIKVFISYSHENNNWLDDKNPRCMLSFWKRSFRHDNLVFWYDRDEDSGIKGSDRWRDKIFEEIDIADIVVLFVTQDFIVSPFIMDEELPRILERAHNRSTELLPILLEPAKWKMLNLHGMFQLTPGEPTPLSEYFEKGEHSWKKARLEILNSLESAVEKVKNRRIANHNSDRTITRHTSESPNNVILPTKTMSPAIPDVGEPSNVKISEAHGWYSIIKPVDEGGENLTVKCFKCRTDTIYDPRFGNLPESKCPNCGNYGDNIESAISDLLEREWPKKAIKIGIVTIFRPMNPNMVITKIDIDTNEISPNILRTIEADGWMKRKTKILWKLHEGNTTSFTIANAIRKMNKTLYINNCYQSFEIDNPVFTAPWCLVTGGWEMDIECKQCGWDISYSKYDTERNPGIECPDCGLGKYDWCYLHFDGKQDGPLRCKYCDKRFGTKDELDLLNPPLKCPNCLKNKE